VFCYPQKDHLPLEEAAELWLLYMDSWAEMSFGISQEVEIFDTLTMGLGK